MMKNKSTEKQTMLAIKRLLELDGWKVWRMPPSIYSKQGIADLCCCRNGITIWIEVKSQKGKLSESQKKFGEEVTMSGGLYIVARTPEWAINVCNQAVLRNKSIIIIPNNNMHIDTMYQQKVKNG